jgi:hypothetical protein
LGDVLWLSDGNLLVKWWRSFIFGQVEPKIVSVIVVLIRKGYPETKVRECLPIVVISDNLIHSIIAVVLLHRVISAVGEDILKLEHEWMVGGHKCNNLLAGAVPIYRNRYFKKAGTTWLPERGITIKGLSRLEVFS